MSRVLTAPLYDNCVPSGHKTLFLAGGITNCPNWQAEAIALLEGYKVVIYNPRRDSFPIDDPKAAEEQIRWEHQYLTKADMVLFWFARGSDNPIVLYEYGRYGIKAQRPVFVGVDPLYSRRQDVIIQTELARTEYQVYRNLSSMMVAVKAKLERMPQIEPGKQRVQIHRFRRGSQGELLNEGNIELLVWESKMPLATFRGCCSDYLNDCRVLLARLLGKNFIVAHEDQNGIMIPVKGDSELRITLASNDPQWCCKCGAEVSPPGSISGPSCRACCTACC